MKDVEVLNKLFDAIAGRFKARPGGYTRIVRVGAASATTPTCP